MTGEQGTIERADAWMTLTEEGSARVARMKAAQRSEGTAP